MAMRLVVARRILGTAVVCALGLLGVAQGFLIAVLLVQNSHQTSDIQQFKDAARASCVSRKTYGPALATAYEKYRILNLDQIAAYRADLPTDCP